MPERIDPRSILEHRVQCGPADLRELADLGFGHALGDGAAREVGDHTRLQGGGVMTDLRKGRLFDDPDYIIDLENEVERLRAALADIAIIGVGITSAREDALEMQRLARKALGKATD
jgi:hypothetical protein